ncbi:MAG: hypothetical protein ACRC9E_13245 [Plesiomonas shigelloides]
MGRRKSTIDNALDAILDVTELFWQVGAIVSILLAIVTYGTARYVHRLNSYTATEMMAIFDGFLWCAYILPIATGVFSLVFGVKAFNTYVRENWM